MNFIIFGGYDKNFEVREKIEVRLKFLKFTREFFKVRLKIL